MSLWRCWGAGPTEADVDAKVGTLFALENITRRAKSHREWAQLRRVWAAGGPPSAGPPPP